MTRLLHEGHRGHKEDFSSSGREFPVFTKHHHHPEPQYHRPITQEPPIFSNSIWSSFIPEHKVSPPKIKNTGQFLGNTIGGAFYDPKHDLVVSYKVGETNSFVRNNQPYLF